MKGLLIFVLLFLALNVLAQDQIYKKNKEIISCKIVEVGLEVIKYKNEDLYDAPLITISLDAVQKVIFANGREIFFKEAISDPNNYADDRQRALKFNFLSPLLEYFAMSYERVLRPGRSFEGEFGIIGVGFNTDQQASSAGIFMSGGYKFLKTPDFRQRELKYSHIMKGTYIKPQLVFSVYENKYTRYSYMSGYSEERDRTVVAMAAVVNVGKQIVFDNIFLIDFSAGLGYGFSNLKHNDNYDSYEDFRANHYGFILGNNQSPIAFAFRLKLGLLLANKETGQ